MAVPSISQYMTHSPISIDADAGIEIGATMMRVNGFQHLPVTREGRVVGIVSARDLLSSHGSRNAAPQDSRIGDIARTDLYMVPADKSLAEVVREMSRRHIGSVLVLDGEAVVGIFTTTDALRALAGIIDRHASV